MRRINIRIRILCLTLPVLMALGLSACSLFGGKGEQDAQDAAEPAGAAGETQEPEREMPSDEGKKENRPASSPGGGKEEEQISWDDFLEPLPERGEAVKEPAQERGEAEPVIDDGEVTLLPEVP